MGLPGLPPPTHIKCFPFWPGSVHQVMFVGAFHFRGQLGSWALATHSSLGVRTSRVESSFCISSNASCHSWLRDPWELERFLGSDRTNLLRTGKHACTSLMPSNQDATSLFWICQCPPRLLAISKSLCLASQTVSEYVRLNTLARNLDQSSTNSNHGLILQTGPGQQPSRRLAALLLHLKLARTVARSPNGRAPSSPTCLRRHHFERSLLLTLFPSAVPPWPTKSTNISCAGRCPSWGIDHELKENDAFVKEP